MKALTKGQMAALLTLAEKDIVEGEGITNPTLVAAAQKLRQNLSFKRPVIDVCGYCGELAHEGKCVEES